VEQQLAKALSLDTAGVTGQTSEVSQPVSTAGANAAQGAVVLQVQTATNVTFQLQESNDLENWSNKGSSQNVSAVGYTLLTGVDLLLSNAIMRPPSRRCDVLRGACA